MREGGVVPFPKPVSNHTRCLAPDLGALPHSKAPDDQHFADTGLRVGKVVPQEWPKVGCGTAK